MSCGTFVVRERRNEMQQSGLAIVENRVLPWRFPTGIDNITSRGGPRNTILRLYSLLLFMFGSSMACRISDLWCVYKRLRDECK